MRRKKRPERMSTPSVLLMRTSSSSVGTIEHGQGTSFDPLTQTCKLDSILLRKLHPNLCSSDVVSRLTGTPFQMTRLTSFLFHLSSSLSTLTISFVVSTEEDSMSHLNSQSKRKELNVSIRLDFVMGATCYEHLLTYEIND